MKSTRKPGPISGFPECRELPVAKEHYDDPINHPSHYTSHPSGVEAIVICEHMSFCVGNAVKYMFRHGLKTNAIEDLKKSRWYIDREISRLEKAQSEPEKRRRP